MGFSSGTLWNLSWLGKAGKIPKGARVLEFGSQNVWGDFEIAQLRNFMAIFGASVPDERLLADTAPGVKVEQLMRDAGFRYRAFDVYSKGATRVFDLNTDSMSWLERGRYDVVTNCGTSEHIANQYNVFKVAHDALKVGGVMMNFVPFHGQIDHGLINYHPKFFTNMIADNRYAPLMWGCSEVFQSGAYDSYRNVNLAHYGPAWEGRTFGCAEMCVIWQKTHRGSFRPPVDISDTTQQHISINQLLKDMPDYSPHWK